MYTQFEDIETIKDDVENIDESVIISFIIQQINVNEKTDIQIISEGIKFICEANTDLFIQKQNQKYLHYIKKTKVPRWLKLQISTLFANYFNQQTVSNMVELFAQFVLQEQVMKHLSFINRLLKIHQIHKNHADFP